MEPSTNETKQIPSSDEPVKRRYVMRMNVPIEHSETGKEKCISLDIDFQTRRNYRVFEGDSFDELDHILEEKGVVPKNYYVVFGAETERALRERHLTPEILADVITIPIVNERTDSDSEDTDQGESDDLP